jgi:hypothetical protein
VREDFLSPARQPFVTARHRAVLVDWLSQVCRDNLLRRQTLHVRASERPTARPTARPPD